MLVRVALALTLVVSSAVLWLSCGSGAGGCDFVDCNCEDFNYTCATFDKELSQDHDAEGRVKTRRLSYTNKHFVTCNYNYDENGECSLAVCRDDGENECRWEPFSLF